MNIDELFRSHGFDSFRPGQMESAQWVLEGESSLSVMRTAEGKSLCYQLPASVLDDLTIVICPLVALMNDQVSSLISRGITAVAIHSDLSEEKNLTSWRRIKAGEIKLLYVSPELASSKSFADNIEGVKIARLIVDEAHCVSEWGHDFRPVYSRIGEISKSFGNHSIHAFTGTANPRVISEIQASLGILTENLFVGEVKRPELEPVVVSVDSATIATKLREIIKERLPFGKIIIYADRVADIKGVWSALLNDMGLEDAFSIYYADLDSEIKLLSAANFASGETQIQLATNAFGMGIDIPDIRTTIHVALPSSIERLWQEMSRAGRDGDSAKCFVFSSALDIPRQWFLQQRGAIRPRDLENVINWLTAKIPDKDLEDYPVERPFNDSMNREIYSEGIPEKGERFGAAIGVLQDSGMVEVRRGRIYFKFSIENYRKHGLPLDLEQVLRYGSTRFRQLLELSRMLDFLDNETLSFQDIVESHFKGQLPEVDLDSISTHLIIQNHIFDNDVLRVILLAVNEKARSALAIGTYLRGGSKVKGDHTASLEGIPSREISTLVDISVCQGYLTSSFVPGGRFLGLTLKGAEYLSIEPKIPTNLAELKKCIRASWGKEILKEVFSEYWVSLPKTAPDISDYCQRAVTEDFSIFGGQVAGKILIEAYAGRTLTAHLKYVDPIKVKRSKTIFVLATLENLFQEAG